MNNGTFNRIIELGKQHLQLVSSCYTPKCNYISSYAAFLYATIRFRKQENPPPTLHWRLPIQTYCNV